MPKMTVERSKKRQVQTGESGSDRVAIMVYFARELLTEIDDYRFGNRFPSRLEAVRALIRKGLDAK